MKKTFLVMLSVITLLAACKKEKNSPAPGTPTSYKDFIKNTEWVGTRDGNGFQYPPPCSLKFNADNTITIYSLFVFFPNDVEKRPDSITGNIISIDSIDDGRIRINTNFNYLDNQTIYITDRKKMTVTRDALSVPTMVLQLFPTKGISVNGEWRGAVWKGAGNYAYPDVSTIAFIENENKTFYTRRGSNILFEPLNILLKVNYLQRGSRITFAGYNESSGAGLQIPYFGVLLPEGGMMMTDSRYMQARLPNYIYTNEPYGPNGVTPIIYRQ